MSDEILNPNIYLNYLQPSDASAYEAARNALLWDVLSSLPEDWQLIRTSKPTPVLFAYFSARICALVMALLSVFVKTGPVTNCGVLGVERPRVLGGNNHCILVSLSQTCPRRIPPRQDRLSVIFTILWLAAFGATLIGLPTPLDCLH
ncbi:hypothetical protein BU15DRAFT_60944 [Melanogaster broomeanus]|nr:hypothetical protein BU15DRAFT_60944 [Melanogaster broomeanus]